MQYFKDRTECFDDYYPCISKSNKICDLHHVYNWIKLFVSFYNDRMTNIIPFLRRCEFTLS